MHFKRQTLAAATLLAFAVSSSGHHALEYIEMDSYGTTPRGWSVFHLHYDYYVDDRDNSRLDHWEITPGLSYGVTDRLMLDIHTHYAKFGADHVVEERRAEFEPDGPSPFLEAVALAAQYRLTEDKLIDVALLGTVEFPLSRSEELLGSEDNAYIGTLILSKDFDGHQNLSLNLIYEIEGSEDEARWALGAKSPVSSDDPHGVAAGIEFLGSFDEVSDNWSVLPGIYMPFEEGKMILKAGLELGKLDGADMSRANITLMRMF